MEEILQLFSRSKVESLYLSGLHFLTVVRKAAFTANINVSLVCNWVQLIIADY